MSKILSFSFPLKSGVRQEDIQHLVNEWVQGSIYYNFDETLLSDEELEGAFASVKGNNRSTLIQYKTRDSLIQTQYLAFRLETRDDANLVWQADVIFSEPMHRSFDSETESCLLVELSRSCADAAVPSDCGQRIKYPSIIKLLFDKGMVQDNSGLHLNKIQFIGELTDIEKAALKGAFARKERTEFPFLYLYAEETMERLVSLPNKESLEDSVSTLLDIANQSEAHILKNPEYLSRLLAVFSRVMHVYVATNPEDQLLWNTLTKSGQSDDSAYCSDSSILNFYYPWLNFKLELPFTMYTDFRQIYQYLIFFLQYSQQNHDAYTPDWNTIQSLVAADESNGMIASYYIRMNQAIANTIQTRRKELNLTQSDLAARLNTTKRTDTTKMLISRLERLQTIKVRRDVIQKLEVALALPAGTLEKLSSPKI